MLTSFFESMTLQYDVTRRKVGRAETVRGAVAEGAQKPHSPAVVNRVCRPLAVEPPLSICAMNGAIASMGAS